MSVGQHFPSHPLYKPGRKSTSRRLVSAGLLVMLALSACTPLDARNPVPTLPPLPSSTSLPPTLTPTATTVWFPPTFTPTPFATPVISPTLDLLPDHGALLLSDDFSNPEPWSLSQTSTTSAALGINVLTLALNQPGGYLFTLRESPVLDNFYLEINARAALCRGQDEYGLLLRVSPNLDFYRFSLSCDGRVRLDKFFQGTASSPQPWQISGAVPPGAPSQSRLAVAARGRQLDFFINEQFQFGVSDPSIGSGSLGLFVRSANDTAVTVSFSDLRVYAFP